MSKFFLLNIDLITREIYDPKNLERIKKKISESGEGNEMAEVFCDVAQMTKDGRIEIYAEDTGIIINTGEEVLSFIKLVESKIGGFTPGSSFEIGKEIPGFSETWTRGEYLWESEEKKTEDYEGSWEDDAYWEDSWDEWNEEWN